MTSVKRIKITTCIILNGFSKIENLENISQKKMMMMIIMMIMMMKTMTECKSREKRLQFLAGLWIMNLFIFPENFSVSLFLSLYAVFINMSLSLSTNQIDDDDDDD